MNINEVQTLLSDVDKRTLSLMPKTAWISKRDMLEKSIMRFHGTPAKSTIGFCLSKLTGMGLVVRHPEKALYKRTIDLKYEVDVLEEPPAQLVQSISAHDLARCVARVDEAVKSLDQLREVYLEVLDVIELDLIQLSDTLSNTLNLK